MDAGASSRLKQRAIRYKHQNVPSTRKEGQIIEDILKELDLWEKESEKEDEKKAGWGSRHISGGGFRRSCDPAGGRHSLEADRLGDTGCHLYGNNTGAPGIIPILCGLEYTQEPYTGPPDRTEEGSAEEVG